VQPTPLCSARMRIFHPFPSLIIYSPPLIQYQLPLQPGREFAAATREVPIVTPVLSHAHALKYLVTISSPCRFFSRQFVWLDSSQGPASWKNAFKLKIFCESTASEERMRDAKCQIGEQNSTMPADRLHVHNGSYRTFTTP
jgi:hypothetical protein